jgi:hypothetical protein
MREPLTPVAIFGLPRSGTTWLGQLLNAHPNILYRYQPLFSYEFKDFLASDFSTEDLTDFHRKLPDAQSEFTCPKHPFKKEEPSVLLYKNVRYHHLSRRMLEKSDIRIIFISRDPLAVLNSWYNAPREFYPEWSIEDEWEFAPSKNQGRPEEFFGFDGWRRAEEMHRENARLFSDRVKIVSYETLAENTELQMNELVQWLELPMHSQITQFIEASAKRDEQSTYSIFKKPSTFTLPQEVKALIIERTKALKNVPYYR